MANLIIDKKEFENYIKLSSEMIEKITMMGIPIEVSGNDVNIEVLPNRPDLLSLQGLVRAIKAFIGKEQGLKKYKTKSSGYKLIVEKSLPREWPYAAACIIKNLKFDDAKIKEAIQIQEKLGITLMRRRKKGGIGIYPLERISFPVTFRGESPDKIKFQPLEYPEAITGRQILSKHPTGREYANICKDWSSLPIFVDSKGKIMSMPPIINSNDLGKIDETTKNIFIEATGTDYNLLKKTINILSTAFAEMGGEIYTIECIQQDKRKESIPSFESEKIKINLENVNNILGINLQEKDLEKLLPRMGYDYKKNMVEIPPWRTDVLHEVDIIEDIAIAYGYDKLEPIIPSISTIGQEGKESKIERKVSEILTGLGLIEISSFHLIKEEEAKKGNIKEAEFIEVENSKTDFKILRPNLLISAYRVFGENKDNEYPQKIFEIGTVFRKDIDGKSETGIGESKRLLISISPSNFTEIKQTLDYLMRMLKIKYELKEEDCFGLIPGRTGKIVINGKKAGIMGESNIESLREWNIKMPVSLVEIDLEEIYKLIQ